MHKGQLKIGHKQKGQQLICDYYLLSKQKAFFSYVAIQDCHAYSLSQNFMHNVIFAKYQDYQSKIMTDSWRHYMLHIFKPMSKKKQAYIADINRLNLATKLSCETQLRKLMIPDIDTMRLQLINRRLTKKKKNKDDEYVAQQKEKISKLMVVHDKVLQGCNYLSEFIQITDPKLKKIVDVVEKNNII